MFVTIWLQKCFLTSPLMYSTPFQIHTVQPRAKERCGPGDGLFKRLSPWGIWAISHHSVDVCQVLGVLLLCEKIREASQVRQGSSLSTSVQRLCAFYPYSSREREGNCVHSARIAGNALHNSEEQERCRRLTNLTKQDQENEVLATDGEGYREGWACVCT